MNISDAKVLITGGSSGIGRETARLLRSQGARVVICATNQARLDEAAAELDVIGHRADVSSEDEVEGLFDFAIDRMQGLNVLINNAGIGHFAPLTETPLDAFERVWKVNVRGAFLAGRRAARHFVAQNGGNIVNIGSSAALRGFANGSAYASSKFALTALTECWRAELRMHNVRVMQVNPSEVITDFFGGRQSNADRKLKPAEIAHVIQAMLAMNDVGFITDAAVWATNP